MNKTTLTLAALALAGSAQAHVTLEQREADAGSSYKAVLKVSHGCAGSPTRKLTVTLPEGLRGAKPMPKAGWTLSLRSAKLKLPYESHGKPVTEGLVEISWTANTEADWLQDAWYDEFVLRATLPLKPGPLWFKVRQDCAQGVLDWAQVPAEGQMPGELESPAALLRVLPRP